MLCSTCRIRSLFSVIWISALGSCICPLLTRIHCFALFLLVFHTNFNLSSDDVDLMSDISCPSSNSETKEANVTLIHIHSQLLDVDEDWLLTHFQVTCPSTPHICSLVSFAVNTTNSSQILWTAHLLPHPQGSDCCSHQDCFCESSKGVQPAVKTDSHYTFSLRCCVCTLSKCPVNMFSLHPSFWGILARFGWRKSQCTFSSFEKTGYGLPVDMLLLYVLSSRSASRCVFYSCGSSFWGRRQCVNDVFLGRKWFGRYNCNVGWVRAVFDDVFDGCIPSTHTHNSQKKKDPRFCLTIFVTTVLLLIQDDRPSCNFECQTPSSISILSLPCQASLSLSFVTPLPDGSVAHYISFCRMYLRLNIIKSPFLSARHLSSCL